MHYLSEFNKTYLIFKVKVWFQNRRMKWKRTKAGLGNGPEKLNIF